MNEIKGYTLIEILIVLLIISIVTSVALISISRNDNRRLKTFAEEFEQIVVLAEERAMLQPEVMGLLFHEHSFQFARLDLENNDKKNSWLPIQEAALSKHVIPDNIQMVLEVGQSHINFSEENTKKNLPQIIISTNGDLTPFTLYIGKKGEKPRYAIVGDADGNVTNKLLS
jgi:general secretion pathway protein H